jgi:undecaprenyl-diphosphatase
MPGHTVTSRALGALTLLSSLFVILGLIAHRAASGSTLDHAVLDWMVRHRHPTLTRWAMVVTDIGSPVGVGVLTLVLATVLWRRLGSLWPAVVVVGAVVGAGIFSTATKIVVGAHRPPLGVQLIAETDPSFPSGHVTGTVALLGAVTAVIGHHGRPAVRAALVAMTIAGGAAVAFTRLYLSVHWVSDVVGGLLLGALAALAAHLVYRYVVRATGGATGSDASPKPEPGRAVGTAPR